MAEPGGQEVKKFDLWEEGQKLLTSAGSTLRNTPEFSRALRRDPESALFSGRLSFIRDGRRYEVWVAEPRGDVPPGGVWNTPRALWLSRSPQEDRDYSGTDSERIIISPDTTKESKGRISYEKGSEAYPDVVERNDEAAVSHIQAFIESI